MFLFFYEWADCGFFTTLASCYVLVAAVCAAAAVGIPCTGYYGMMYSRRLK